MKGKTNFSSRVLPSGKVQYSTYVKTIDNVKHRFYATANSPADAQISFEAQTEAINNRIKYGDALKNGEKSVCEACEAILTDEKTEILEEKGRTRREGTVNSYMYAYKALIQPQTWTKKTAVKNVTQMDLQKWREAVQKAAPKGKQSYEASYKNKAYKILQAALSCYFDHSPYKNPMDGIKPWVRYHKKITADNALIGDEYIQFMNYCLSKPYDFKKSAAFIQASCYLRPGEVLALKVKDYDPNKRTLHIQRTLIKQHYISDDGRVKTPDSDREIELISAAETVIKRNCLNKKPDDLLFPTPAGKVCYSTNYNKWFKRVLKFLNIDKNLHVHNLRTSGISYAIANDASIKGVSANAGHSSIKTTLSCYTAIYPEEKGKAVATMENALKDLIIA